MSFANMLKSRRVQLLLVCVALAMLLLAVKGPNIGIEFRGGVRIPITLISEKDVSSDVMSQTVDTLKQRINKYGLSQSVVRPLGNKEIIVEVPKADESVIKSIEKILREQGRFEALVDGKTALEGKEVLQNSIGGANGERVTPAGNGYKWELDFAVTKAGGEQFAKVALGKANYPVYMMLDRPENAAIIIPRSQFNQIGDFGNTDKALHDALRKQDADIDLIYAEDLSSQANRLQNRTRVVISQTLYQQQNITTVLSSQGFSTDADARKMVVLRTDEEMAPETYSTQLGVQVVSKWRAVGLLSAPILSEGLAHGTASQSYSITGSAAGATPDDQKKNALADLKELKSVISGGKLPVSTVIGSAYVVAPSLGEQFLTYSLMGMVFAIIVVSTVIVVRYRKPTLVVPIMVVSVCEIFLTASAMAVFGTLDLSAVAGIIALIGTGVNDQIIISDEVLKHGRIKEDEEQVPQGIKERVGKAFYIIFAVAGAIIAAMLPLFLSGIVEVMGFALSTIIGVIIGISITRPAFGVILQELM